MTNSEEAINIICSGLGQIIEKLNSLCMMESHDLIDISASENDTDELCENSIEKPAEEVTIHTSETESKSKSKSESVPEIIDCENIRARMIQLIKNGKGEFVRSILSVYGIERLSELDESHYKDVFNMIISEKE